MDRLGFENLSLYFLKLVRYGADVERAQRELPPEKPEEIEWEDVYKLADKHSLTALTYRVVQNLKEKPSKELLKKWEHEYMVGLLADSQQLYAWEELQEVFSEKGLKILPLKGIYLKELYPETVLRQMGDLDVLYEKERFSEVKAAMKELGYTFQSETIASNHQIFNRAPVTEVEMHSDLLPLNFCLYDYYKEPWEKAVKTERENVYKFNRNDEYLFLAIHAAKHFAEFGNGVRTIVDFYLYRRKYKQELDFAYIQKEIEKADEIAVKNGEKEIVSEFEKLIIETGKKWMEQEEFSLSGTDVGLLTDGVYGHAERAWERAVQKEGSKFKYIMRRIFPPFKDFKAKHPSLKKFPFLLPFFWFKRFCRGVFKKRKTTMRELRYLNVREEKKKSD